MNCQMYLLLKITVFFNFFFFGMVIRVYAVGSSCKLHARLEPFFKPIVSTSFFFFKL